MFVPHCHHIHIHSLTRHVHLEDCFRLVSTYIVDRELQERRFLERLAKVRYEWDPESIKRERHEYIG